MKKRLHEKIFDTLRREILSHGIPGERLPSEAEMSKRFKVSIVTLRNATQALEAEGFVKRLSGVGVVVCERKKHGHLALVFRDTALCPRPLYFHLRFNSLLQRNLLRAGWRTVTHLQITSDPDGLDELREGIARGRYTGVIWTLGDTSDEFSRLAEKHGVALLGGRKKPLVEVDYDAMIRSGVDHLVHQGCRRIAGLFPGSDTEFPRANDLHASRIFREQLALHGLTTTPGWVVQNSEAQLLGSGWQGFRDLWAASQQRPDGILVLDDVMYRDAARAIMELGIKVPSELKIVTHSNRTDDLVHPFPVTLLEVDPEEMAEAAAEYVIQSISGQTARMQNVTVRLIPSQEETMRPATALKQSVRK